MKIQSLGIGILVAVLGITIVNAGSARRAPVKKRCVKRKLDKNKDGKVGPRELAKGRKECREKRSVVDKKWEERADKNDNGKVDGKEYAAARRHLYLKNRSEVDKKWEEKADKNDNGTIEGKELHVFRKDVLDKNDDGKVTKKECIAARIHRKSKVSNTWEKKHDADGDGWISKEEAKAMLKDRLRLINTCGRARVNCSIEKQFDTNNDGVIDRQEAKALIEFLKEKKAEKPANVD